jgi:hypothetical protein
MPQVTAGFFQWGAYVFHIESASHKDANKMPTVRIIEENIVDISTITTSLAVCQVASTDQPRPGGNIPGNEQVFGRPDLQYDQSNGQESIN